MIEALSGGSSQAELCRCHNLSADQLSKWKHQLLENAATLFESTDKQSDGSIERIAQLEQLVGNRLTLALEIQKNPWGNTQVKHFAELNPSEQRCLVETLRTDYSVWQICETLGFNKSTLHYQPKIDPCEEVLRTEIEELAARYPKSEIKGTQMGKRLQDIKSIRDTATRHGEYEEVMREITADPSKKKIIKKGSIFGKGPVLSILEVINAF